MPEAVETAAVETEPVTEPVVEETPFELPEDFADQVKGWDVPVDEIAQAVALHKALQTEDGVIDAFIRTGQSLGFGIKELQRLFAEDPEAAVAAVAAVTAAPAPTVDPILGDDPDRLLTAAEVKAIMDRERESFDQRFTQSEQARQQESFEQRQKQVFGAIDGWFTANGITDANERRMIAQLGEATILPNQDSYDPAVSLAALERGKAEYDTFLESQAAKYIAKKAGTAQAQPTAVGGGSAAGAEEEGEVNYKDLRSAALSTAKERVRARLRDAGEM